MIRLRQSFAGPILAAVCLLAAASAASAGTGPKWSSAQLADFADVVVTGRVDAVASAWDPAVNTIYTYITLDVDQIFKGSVGDRIVIKQLGGEVDGIGLVVADQATFSLGERVLLYLEARPRDGTLYTTAQWQGKWSIDTDAGVATRTVPSRDGGAGVDQVQMSEVRIAAAAAPARARAFINAAPPEAPSASAQPFTLFGFRFLTPPPVDVQSGGQPGLSGGGFTQIMTAMSIWNNAGTGTRYVAGSPNGGARCSSQFVGNGRVTITFMDPCGEMSNSGGTLAIGGAYFFNGGGGTVGGRSFNRAADGFVVNNDSSTALSLLTNPRCFQDIQLHELGHVLGLDHTNDSSAIMFPSINNNCFNQANSIGTDDRNGLAAVYGSTTPAPPPPTPGLTPPSSAPTNVTVTVNGLASLTVSWNAVTAYSAGAPSAATGYRVDFRTSPTAPVLVSLTSTSTTLSVGIPAGVVGTFYVSVTGVNSAGNGPTSGLVPFTIGGGPGPCASAPSPVTGVTGGVSGGVARVQWNASAGATSYLLQAGTSQGAANIVPLSDFGATTAVQAPVPSGFTAWVRIFARNACGTSTGVDFFIQ